MSQEAMEHKERRREAEKRREAKALKKIRDPVVPARTTTSTVLDPNSAAARRLAQKKGLTSSSGATLSSTQAPAPAPAPVAAVPFEAFEVNFDEAPSFENVAGNDRPFAAHFEENWSVFEQTQLLLSQTRAAPRPLP